MELCAYFILCYLHREFSVLMVFPQSANLMEVCVELCLFHSVLPTQRIFCTDGFSTVSKSNGRLDPPFVGIQRMCKMCIIYTFYITYAYGGVYNYVNVREEYFSFGISATRYYSTFPSPTPQLWFDVECGSYFIFWGGHAADDWVSSNGSHSTGQGS